jgi:hypothetical protein
MKKLKMFLLSFVLLSTMAPINTFAASLEKIPSSLSSKQWSVVIGKADSSETKNNKSKPNVFNVYSMDIKSIGKEDVNLVRIEAYRDEPNSSPEFELFTIDPGMKSLQPNFHHANFPLSVKASKLKVVITWTKKSDNGKYPRKYREQFLFEQ